ncbi:hypothetical protein FS837_009419 [Tulasnella sp. UAMH 9824]|nr:hypothetical protein FS837_009419 [Tulasnella sp. UAMH 9824]
MPLSPLPSLDLQSTSTGQPLPPIPAATAYRALVIDELQGLIFPQLLVFRQDGRLSLKQPDLGFKREPDLEDWKRLEYYTRRIHRMRLDFPFIVRAGFARYFATLILERSVLPIFGVDGRSPLPLFPKLNSLELEVGGAISEVPLCTAIIDESPVLDSFEVNVCTYADAEITYDTWLAMFASLRKHGRTLKRLAIRSEKQGSGLQYVTDRKAQLTTELAQLIDRTKLQELVLPRDLIENGVIFNTIPYIPTLKTLENAFSSLECLKVELLEGEPILTVPSLRSLAKLVILGDDLFGRAIWGLQVVRSMVMAVGQNCPTLEVLHVFMKLRSQEPSETSQSGWPTESVFAPLQACSRLQDVRFDFSETSFADDPSMEKELDLSDEQWEQLALAWPGLRSMWFYAGPRYDEDQGWVGWTPRTTVPRPRATLKAIASFFRNCPNLSRLHIPVLARGEEARAAPEIGSARDPVQLDLRGSWIDKADMQDVAIFPAALAPKTDVQVPRTVSHYELNVEVQGALYPEERTIEIARRGDWQGIRQLVDCAQNFKQSGRS